MFDDQAGAHLAEELPPAPLPAPFPEHDPNGPDVDPATGDERETTDENGDPL